MICHRYSVLEQSVPYFLLPRFDFWFGSPTDPHVIHAATRVKVIQEFNKINWPPNQSVLSVEKEEFVGFLSLYILRKGGSEW